MSNSKPPHEEDHSLLDQTLYLATRIYDDPHTLPISLDIHSACAIGSYECVKEAIESGIDFNARNKAGWTPLMYASYVGHDTVVNLLLDSGAEASRGTPINLTPLMVAAGCGNESVCYFLLQAGAKIDTQDSMGYTALVHSVRQGHQTVVQLLLEAGADIELADYENGYTPLMQASLEGDEIIVDVLVACDADLNARDKNGDTCRSLAYKHHHVRTATQLDNAMFMFNTAPANSDTLTASDVSDKDEEEDGDLFSGAKEAEAYQQSKQVRKSIQEMLGRRAGPRWSLPHQYIAARRESAPSELGVGQRNDCKLLMQSCIHSWFDMYEVWQSLLVTIFVGGGQMSMPDSEMFVDWEVNSPETKASSSVDTKLVDFLTELKLEKYIEVFEEQEIDFLAFLSLTDEDLKRLGVKLMGPRRKISVAVSEFKAQRETGDSSDGSLSTTPDIKAEQVSSKLEKSPQNSATNKMNDKLKLVKQASTQLSTAYQQAMEKIGSLEEQLSKEIQLRKITDSYILDLQAARQEAVGCIDQVKTRDREITRHFKSVKETHGKLTDEVDCLRLLTTSSTVDPSQFRKLYSEIVSQCSKMGLEFEALSRSIDAAKKSTETLTFHMRGN